MNLIDDLPGPVDAEARKRLGDSEIRLAVETDILEDGAFGRAWIVADGAHVLVLSPDGDGGTVQVRDYSLEGLKTARLETMVGCAKLVLEWEDRRESVARCSGALAARVGEAAWALERLAKEGAYVSSAPEPRVRCTRCGRLLSKDDGTCSACVDKVRVMGRVTRYLRPYRGLVVALSLVALVGVAISLIQPQIARYLIDNVLRVDVSTDDVGDRIRVLLLLVGAMILARLGHLVTEIGLRMLTPRLAMQATADLREELFRRIEFLPLTFFDKRPVGAIMSRITHDCERLQDFLAEGAPFLVNNVLTTFAILLVLLAMDPLLAVLVLLPVPILVFGGGILWRCLRGLMHRWWQKWSSFSAFLNESFSGIRLVKAFAQEDRQVDGFDVMNRGLMRSGIRAETAWGRLMPVMGFVMSTGTFIVWAIGGARIVRGETMTLGKLVAFLGYLTLLYGPLQWFSRVYQWMTRALSGAERVFDVMDMTPEAMDADGAVAIDPIEGAVGFEGVTFGYDRSKPVLHEITFDVKPGEMIGLVGKSGVGKSTLIKLLCRFYDVDRGRLLIDGTEIRELDLRTLRRQIGVVPQEPFFFDGTVAENIAFGRPEATFDQILESARLANAHEFICQKPDGYDSRVGERGGKLSGGEKQRIAIARAILRDPRILILDEATSAVDSETEKLIQEALRRLVHNRTTFAIAHRLSTLRHADRLVVLEGGRITEMGTHAELMEKEDGIFRKLVDIQRQTSAIIEVGT